MYKVMVEDLDGEIYVMNKWLIPKNEIEAHLKRRYGAPIDGKYIDSIGRAFWVEYIKEVNE